PGRGDSSRDARPPPEAGLHGRQASSAGVAARRARPAWGARRARPAWGARRARPAWGPQFDTGLHGRHERHQESWEGVTSDGPDPSTPLDGRRRRPRRGLLPDRLASAERAPDRPPRYPRPGGG